MSRRPFLVGTLLVAWVYTGPSCVGTNTGNPDCAAPRGCAYPVRATVSDGRAFRGHAGLSRTGAGALSLDAWAVEESGATCVDRSGSFSGQLSWTRSHGSVTADGGLHVHFDHPEVDSAVLADEIDYGSVMLEGSSGAREQRNALSLDLVFGRDGHLRGSVVTMPDGVAADASLPDGGSLRQELTFEGDVSVECDQGAGELALPTASGEVAHVRCGIVPPQQPACDDTPSSGCGVMKLGAR